MMQSLVAQPARSSVAAACRERSYSNGRPTAGRSMIQLHVRMQTVLVRASLNKFDRDSQLEESDFDRETARLAVRMLTARAAGMVLQNVAQVDDFKAAWLQEHFKQNPPIEGNDFLTNLLEAKPVYATDPYTGAGHHINPAAIANAVLVTREALAAKLSKSITPKVQDANIGIMRSHLERHTYVSGSNDDVKPSFRQYRNRQQPQQQRLTQ
eukprot:GHRQ01000814.1.p1 GENE.GHRQ01000814.1~~GHRQ01000814.1.p1  ORF type:complete len:211 (+),score=71.48 GHRQ01000814.1:222-854(+)